jgi:flagellar biosynthesis/type III secretory pathway chaperone
MSDEPLFELMQKQLTLLKQFMKVLVEERDAIISFSLEGISRANATKEELLKRLESLEDEQQRLSTADCQDGVHSSEWVSLQRDLESCANDARITLEKNMKLLTFSMDHVKSCIERIVGFINKTSYGRKRDSISVMGTRRV